ncbi:transcriptional regulator [Brevirhabdus pacifica]|uniref:Transcriptional regulator n=1 Tax=Brevirhabdus pacifica TaxID=1267768 RepID=A0A1U7DG09_9RHOB|nr:helix-turn-helix domain-containing protein [Brevirhabdus pacifica]APX88940.1 transcriptional regulator [Brevirhabdus pacifica]OWU80166.1 XRE family transcriptional regulator [Loktanella sp. 22II-4b]PJJ86507.1 helix-turn-helix protein [Brevirhabdus pacifica]
MQDRTAEGEGANGDEGGWFSEDTATFGDRLAAAREQLGLTQEGLARRLGVKHKTVRAWEDDMSEPRANKLQMMAGVLNVSIVWLLTGQGMGVDAPGTATEDLPGGPQDVAAILTEMRKLRADMVRAADRLGVLEKRLRTGGAQ